MSQRLDLVTLRSLKHHKYLLTLKDHSFINYFRVDVGIMNFGEHVKAANFGIFSVSLYVFTGQASHVRSNMAAPLTNDSVVRTCLSIELVICRCCNVWNCSYRCEKQ